MENVSYKNVKGEVTKTTVIEEPVDLAVLKNQKAELENKVAENIAINKQLLEKIKGIDEILDLGEDKL